MNESSAENPQTLDFAFVLDVDGTVTDGSMHYTQNGKYAKVFGPDDWCMLKALSCQMPVHFVTGDRKGFAITQRRIEEECGYPLDLVPVEGRERWKAIQALYPKHRIIFMGDGVKDWYCLAEAFKGITTADALDHVRRYAHYITSVGGGKRAVAEACMYLIDTLDLERPDWLPPPMRGMAFYGGKWTTPSEMRTR